MWILHDSKFGMKKWEANRIRQYFNINKLHLIWIQELYRIRNLNWDVLSLPYTRNKRRSEIFFYISLDFPWDMWNAMYRVFRKALRRISMFPLIETIWNKLSGTLFEFNLIYLQGYSFSCGQCTCTWVCIILVFFPTH